VALPLRYNVLSLAARPTSSLSSIGLIALVIATFAYLQAVTDSAFNTMAATGDPNTILVLSQAATSESVSRLGKDELNKLAMTPDVVHDGAGPIVSPEIVAISSAFTKGDDRVAVNAAVRGVDFEAASKVRHGRVRIVEGRAYQPGTYEVIVGQAAHRLYRGHNVGDQVQLGTRGPRLFTIVGVFTTDGTAADSELWAYVETVRDVFARTGYSSARMIVPDEQAARRAVDFIRSAAIGLGASDERTYFRELNTNQAATQYLSVAMIVIMGIAAAFAVANTMYAAVAGRIREIGMLRAVGFARVSILTAFVLEGLILAAAGGALGCALSLVSHGLQRNVLPATFTTVSYSLAITPKIVGTSLAVAVAIGLLGSILPAWRAAKMSVTAALREA
jgi:ABC-type lipoprotein release transport system permease subunit